MIRPIRCKIVGGWGAVEQEAASWSPNATIDEIAPRVWVVSDEGGEIGVIAKKPWTEWGAVQAYEEWDLASLGDDAPSLGPPACKG